MAAPPASAAECLDALALSCEAEGAADIGVVCSALCRIHVEYTARLHADEAWCRAYASVAGDASPVVEREAGGVKAGVTPVEEAAGAVGVRAVEAEAEAAGADRRLCGPGKCWSRSARTRPFRT